MSATSVNTFPTTTVQYRFEQGKPTLPVVVPCEPINELLAITPALSSSGEQPALLGSFLISHRPTGMRLPAWGCLSCCRSVGEQIAALGIDWNTGDADHQAFEGPNNQKFLERLDTAQREALTGALQRLNCCASTDCYTDQFSAEES